MLAPFVDSIRANNQKIAVALGEHAASMLQLQIAPLQNALAAVSAAHMQRLAALMPEANVFQAVTQQLIPAIVRLGTAIEGWLPVNWPESPGVFLTDAVAVVNAGVPLVWVPRAAIVAELTSAPDDAGRGAILAASSPEISEDCSAVLAEVARPELKALAALAAEAARALRAEFPAPAQALAANVFDTLLRDATGRGIILNPVPKFWYGHVLQQIGPVGDKTMMTEFRQACVLAPAVPALQKFLPGDPVPATFARHATAHSAGPDQYTEVNAVISLMLATSMLREAEESGW